MSTTTKRYRFKQFLKRVLPLTHRQLQAETDKIGVALANIQESATITAKVIADEVTHRAKEHNSLMTDHQKSETNILNKVQESIGQTNKLLSEFVAFRKRVDQKLDQQNKIATENLWANVFNSTICDSKWFKNRALTPGRAALGYVQLYVLYRILDDMHPASVMDIGLGQSSSMITQYAEAYCAEHVIVENDADWCAYYLTRHTLSAHSRIQQLSYEMRPFHEAQNVRQYQDFASTFVGKQFEMILVDAPYSVDMKEYARVDIYSLIPECLNPDRFVIMIDDTERVGETNTTKAICAKLDDSGVAYCSKIYRSLKNCTVICSAKTPFYCTL